MAVPHNHRHHQKQNKPVSDMPKNRSIRREKTGANYLRNFGQKSNESLSLASLKETCDWWGQPRNGVA
jgi:hypothetical protein